MLSVIIKSSSFHCSGLGSLQKSLSCILQNFCDVYSCSLFLSDLCDCSCLLLQVFVFIRSVLPIVLLRSLEQLIIQGIKQSSVTNIDAAALAENSEAQWRCSAPALNKYFSSNQTNRWHRYKHIIKWNWWASHRSIATPGKRTNLKTSPSWDDLKFKSDIIAYRLYCHNFHIFHWGY